jgi:hypothetical protein
VERTVGLVESGSLAEVGVVLQLVAEELTRNVQSLTADNNNLLTVEELLGDNRGETAKKMALTCMLVLLSQTITIQKE